MPRDGAAARARLRESALDLYTGVGYERTTTAEIAARAGLTERTYFRHFADKREVLFDGEAELQAVMVDAIRSAAQLRPLELVIDAYRAAVPLLIKNRPIAERRATVIATSAALQERAHTKAAALADALTTAIVDRGEPMATARLSAQVGAAVFSRAAASWASDPSLDLDSLILQAAEELRRLIS